MWVYPNSEVTDLKRPHGTKWQCANSTIAISWPNHVQILSFASMASRQGAVKHGFVSKIAGGCSSYDVIAPWPDLVNLFSHFSPKVAQGLPHKVPQNPAAVFCYLRKTSAGVAPAPPPPVRARVRSCEYPISFHLKKTLYEAPDIHTSHKKRLFNGRWPI